MILTFLALLVACDPNAAAVADATAADAPGRIAPGVVALNVPGADASAHPITDPAVRAAIGTLAVDDRYELSDGVFLGQVVRVQYRMSEPVEDSRGAPFTFITWKVEKAWKGAAAGDIVTARIFGGPTPNGGAMAVSEQPIFQEGDRDVIFLDSTTDGASPIIGGSAGRYRILEGGMYTDEGTSVGVDADGELTGVGHREFPELDVLVIGDITIEREHTGPRIDAGRPGLAEGEFVRWLDQRFGAAPNAPRVRSADADEPFVFAHTSHRFVPS